jgi:hypothetical protein
MELHKKSEKQLVLAFFANEGAADEAVKALKEWYKTTKLTIGYQDLTVFNNFSDKEI